MDETIEGNIAAPAGLELRVLSGLHAGAALPLTEEAVVVGSDTACDVILLDPDVAPQHLSLRWVDGQWLAEPGSGADVADLAGRPLHAGSALAPGLPFRIGQAWLMLSPADAPWETAVLQPSAPPVPEAARPGRRWPLALPAVTALALLLLVLAWCVLRSPSAQPPSAAAAPAAAAVPAEADEIARQTERVLSERDLSKLVGIVYETGHLTLSAELDADESRRFDSALASLRQRFGTRVRIDVALTPLQRALPFDVREIVTGSAPHITLADGTVMYEGTSMAGYRLQAIRPGKLLFDGKRQLELPW
ncbi:FHA domain-containing protein [Pseudoduganella sp. R-34]|uniref:FHA domain-containing protein n=1 Tax=Pseudoduganella sp. R-34 TaxID=3404062 RepID=UPI003CE97907